MTGDPRIPPELRYLEQLVGRLRAAVELEAAYLIGSAAVGSYEHGRSDVDVVAVTEQPLGDEEKRTLAETAEALPCPARKLELVVYARGRSRYELNLNTGEYLSLDPDNDQVFWFVLDLAAAEQHAIVLTGEPWRRHFAPVEREQVPEAIGDALDWQEREEPLGRSSVLNACRGWRWLRTAEWVSKPAAADWLRHAVRCELEAAR